MTSTPLAVFDIDGVLADVRHRLHHLERRPKNWAAFFTSAPADPVWDEGVRLVAEAAQDCEIVYLTGRPETSRKDTAAWLARHGLPKGTLSMRRAGDRRPAARTKPQQLAALAEGRTVAVVVDDDPGVCAAYRRAGWPVLHADWAAAAPALRAAQGRNGRT